MKITKNLSRLDQTFRCLAGIITLVAVAFGHEIISEPFLIGFLILFGVLNLISFATGWCIVYHLTGINTNPETKNDN